MMDDLKRIAGLFQAKNNKEEVEEEAGQTQGTAPTEDCRGEPCVHPEIKEYTVKIPASAKKQDLITLKEFLK
jgi:hypothetical protein